MTRLMLSLLGFFFVGCGALIITGIIRRRRIERQAALDRLRTLWAQLEALVRDQDRLHFPIVLELRLIGKPAIPFLLEQWARNPNVPLAEHAWSALWGIASPKTPELIAPSLEKLADRNHRIRFQAIRILEQIGAKAKVAVPDLRHIMDEDEDVQAQSAAILALKAITGIRA